MNIYCILSYILSIILFLLGILLFLLKKNDDKQPTEINLLGIKIKSANIAIIFIVLGISCFTLNVIKGPCSKQISDIISETNLHYEVYGTVHAFGDINTRIQGAQIEDTKKKILTSTDENGNFKLKVNKTEIEFIVRKSGYKIDTFKYQLPLDNNIYIALMNEK